jgi:GT2 family glycosyltransferase
MRAGIATVGLWRPLVFQHNDLMPGPPIARAVRTVARRADVVVAASDCIARELRLPHVQVIHPGVDLERFEPTPPIGAEVLLLGAVEPWKRPELALEIVAIAARERPDIRLRIGGEPIGREGQALLSQMRARAEQPDLAGHVEFAGRVDAAEALTRATCLLHCADREPYGMVLAEALAAGRPVVAPASCGPLEIVDETCGHLYQPGNPHRAANAVLDALDHAEELGAAGRRRAEQHFSVKTTRERYRNLFLTPDTRQPTPELALVTVTHNSEIVLPSLLASANRHLPTARVIVVDSGSSDASAEIARAAGAHVIELDDNVGFGRASNIGVAQVAQDVTILVNPDVELVDDSLARLARELHDADRILAPLVLRPDGSRQDSAQVEPGSPAALAIALLPPVLMPRSLRHAACPWTSNEPRSVGWAIGACLAARTKTLKQLGPFDERIFLYAEDLDLCLRAADAGIETWFHPEARVIHRSAHSTDPSFGGEAFELLANQRQDVLTERRGATVARRDRLLQALTFADRIAFKTLAGRGSERERKQLRAAWRR